MKAKGTQFSQLGGIEPGPSSSPDEDTGHEWLNQRTAASQMDAAFARNDQQRWLRELGPGTTRIVGEPNREPHPVTGRLERVGEGKSMATPPHGVSEREGLHFNVRDYSAPGFPSEPIVRQEPVEHVYRGMSEEEFHTSQRRGYVQSDERGVIQPGWEGTNADVDPASAHSYLPREGPGRIVKIAVHPEDKWFASDVDTYARTRNKVPWSRVASFTSPINKGEAEAGSIRAMVVKRQKEEGVV